MEGLFVDDREVRSQYLDKAQKAIFLDAVFYITCYNKNRKPLRKPIEIEPCEVFADYNAGEYQSAVKRSEKLLAEAAHVGMAFHNYSGSGSYEDALIKLKKENPGFGDKCYGLSVNGAILAMR
ncbi:hypothetical protein ACFL4N_05150 [Thermodesulfobacteriota bacterium]